MKAKYILYLGILLLLVGILFRYFMSYANLGIGLVIGGVVLKLAYITYTIVKGQYQPRAEFFLLIGGLVFLFLGLWHKLNVSEMIGYAMIAAAITLKLIFILLFIRKMKRHKVLIKH